MNCEKFTRNQSGNILVHCDRSDPNRTYKNQEIDHSKTYLNYNLAPEHTGMTDYEFMKKRCEEFKVLKRKDVNWLVSWVITMPTDYKGNKALFFREAYNFMANRYGKGNVVSAYVHLDETSPHMHFCFVPVIFDKKKQEYKVNAKQCINKVELKQIHPEMQEYLENKLQTKVNILNGATAEGNKTIDQLKKEENPALGYRAIRICLTRPDIFKTQLRALYRASVYGNLGIMFPMITSVLETEKVLDICNSVKAELDSEGMAYSENIELGIMIETPAAAVISDKLAPLVDFFSVGTNDLTQYTLACYRQNPDIEQFVDTHHEAVLRLIEMSATNAHKHGAWIGICGELGADTKLTEKFLRMGIDELSVSPSFVLKVRETVRNINLSQE